jgi:hypothetical protein
MSAHLYILTDARLYILAGERLDGLVDVSDGGQLLTGESGFGLLEAKAFSWFSVTGERAGVVRTRDPIRRVLSTADGLVVETRQHRARIGGALAWWTE